MAAAYTSTRNPFFFPIFFFFTQFADRKRRTPSGTTAEDDLTLTLTHETDTIEKPLRVALVVARHAESEQVESLVAWVTLKESLR